MKKLNTEKSASARAIENASAHVNAMTVRVNGRTYERKEGSADTLNGDYVMESVTIIVARALKTIYQASGDIFILRLINSIPVSIRRRNGELWLDNESVDGNGNARETMTNERHAHKIGGLSILSYEREPELTEWGRATSATIKASARLDAMTTFDDLVSVGVLRVYELASAGLIACDRDLWEKANRKEVFKAVNSAIYGERKTEKATRKNTVISPDGDETDVFNFIESKPEYSPEELWEECVSFVEYCHGDKKDLLICYGRSIGYTDSELGKKLGISHVAIVKRVNKMRKRVLNDPDNKRRCMADYRAYNRSKH